MSEGTDMSCVRKVVRVYVSSTFRDMHAEREVLETVVFPELRLRSEHLGIDVIKIDPCYGVTEEEAEGDAALGRRLQILVQCRPYCIGLLGCTTGGRSGSAGRSSSASPSSLTRTSRVHERPAL
jgi:hypothetical protein